MRLGVHVSTAGHIYEAPERAAALGCNTMQIFSRSPQKWRDRSLEAHDLKEFAARVTKFKIRPVFIHIPYLINLASPSPKLYRASIKAYVEDIQEARKLKADYIVTHMGSHKQTSEEAGLKRLITALNIVLKETRDSGMGILLENTAGGGSWLGYKFIHQKIILDGLQQKERVGLCFDTAHAFAAGYDISTKEGLQATLDEINKLVGLKLLKLVHLNDTPDTLGSRRDRHQHIGKGKIGLSAMKRIVNHPALRKAAFILETPKDSEGKLDRMNLSTVRKLRRTT